MGGGGLRILPHKSWHVWRRENIERVLRDEREQAEAQTRAEHTHRRVEQERRAEALVKRSGAQSQQKQQEEQRKSADSKETAHGVRLFALEEQRHEQQISSDARAATQQQTLGKQAALPWYAQRQADERVAPLETSRQERKRKRALEDEDPLRHMRPRRAALGGDSDASADDFSTIRRSKDTEERTRREYRSEYSRSAESRSTVALATERRRSDTSSSSRRRSTDRKKKKKAASESAMQQLRREREEREQNERRRADTLLRGW